MTLHTGLCGTGLCGELCCGTPAGPTPPTMPPSPFSVSMWLGQSVSIASLVGYSRGAPVYSAAAAADCYVCYKLQNILGADGNEVVSDSYLLLDGSVTVAPYDLVTLPDGTKRPVKHVASATMPIGANVLKVVYL